MPYSYYAKLSSKAKKIYRASDKIAQVKIHDSESLLPYVRNIKEALLTAEKKAVQNTTQTLVIQLTQQLEIPPVKVKVLKTRPHNNYGELHGLYEGVSKQIKTPEISVWMLTAKRKQVVAFKTYMRTLLHELCHHIDYELFKLEDSFHTEGFFKRESSLYNQLII